MEVRIVEQSGQEPVYVASSQDSTKKKAEQQAARIALDHLRSQEQVQAEQA
jgi:dsRNA-specific ribonuclease